MLPPPGVQGSHIAVAANGDGQEVLIVIRPHQRCVARAVAEQPTLSCPEFPSAKGEVDLGAVTRRQRPTSGRLRKDRADLLVALATDGAPKPGRVRLRGRPQLALEPCVVREWRDDR